MEEKSGITTIRIRVKTRVALAAMGSKGETYDDILSRILTPAPAPKKGKKK